MSTLYPGGDYPVTPNLGLALWDMSFEMAENMILIDTAVGSGSSVQINGSVIANPNFNNTTPAAPAGKSNVLWQVSGSSVSAYVDSVSVKINGATTSNPNFNNTTPSAPGGSTNVTWQVDGTGNVSAYFTAPAALWSALGNATADLTLANAGFNTTFNQTSATNWTWANTTAASAPSVTYGFTVVESVLSDAGNFTAISPYTAPKVPSSGLCEPATLNTTYAAYWSGRAWGADQFSEVTVATVDTNSYFSPIVRVNGVTPNNYYQFNCKGSISGFYKIVAGVATQLGQLLTMTVFAGDKLRLTVSGNVLTLTQNGTLISTITDSTFAAGSPGFALFQITGAITSNQISSWTGGEFINQNSPVIKLAGTIYNGSSSVADTWSFQNVPNNNIQNPVTNLSITHSGSTGTAIVQIPSQLNLSTDTGISRVSAGLVAVGNGGAGDFTGALKLGAITEDNATAATGSVSQSSPIYTLSGRYWDGAASQTDSWTLQDVIANGTNGTSTLTFTHTGSSGIAAVSVPILSATSVFATNVGSAASGIPDAWLASGHIHILSTANWNSFEGQSGGDIGYNFYSSKTNALFNLNGIQSLGWLAQTFHVGNADVNLSRMSAGNLSLGSGVAGDSSGILSLGGIVGSCVHTQMATTPSPTVTALVGAGAATWGYKVVAKDALGSSIGSSEATITNAANLTNAAANKITIVTTPGAQSYDVYRTTVGTSPSTTGKIGNISTASLLNSTFLVDAGVLTLSFAANASSGTTVYTGTLSNIAANSLVGATFVVAGFVTGANNGTFTCTANTTTTLTLNNASGANESHAATATQTGDGTAVSVLNTTGTLLAPFVAIGVSTTGWQRIAAAGTFQGDCLRVISNVNNIGWSHGVNTSNVGAMASANGVIGWSNNNNPNSSAITIGFTNPAAALSGVIPLYTQQVNAVQNMYAKDGTGFIGFQGTSNGISIAAVAAPVAPTVTVAAGSGATTWGYKVVAKDASGVTIASSEGTVANNATLNGNAVQAVNKIAITRINGAVSYDIYRTTVGTSPSTTGLIGNIADTGTLYQTLGATSTSTVYSINDFGSNSTVTSVAAPSGSTSLYLCGANLSIGNNNGCAGLWITITGCVASNNNGRFFCIKSNSGQLFLINPNSTAAAGQSGAATVAGDGTVPPSTGLNTAGGINLIPPTSAIPGTVAYSSGLITLGGYYFNGSGVTADSWTIQNAIGPLTNDSSLLELLHSGTPGTAGVLIGNTSFTTAIASSPYLILGGSYEISVSLNSFAEDNWYFQNVIGAGANGTSTLNITHTGTSGVSKVQMPALSLTGILYDGTGSAGANTNVLTSTSTGIQWSATSSLSTNASKIQGVAVAAAAATPAPLDALQYVPANTDWESSTTLRLNGAAWSFGSTAIGGAFGFVFASLSGNNIGFQSTTAVGVAATGNLPPMTNCSPSVSTAGSSGGFNVANIGSNPVLGNIRRFKWAIRLTQTASMRIWIGLGTSSGMAPATYRSDTPAAAIVGFRYSTSAADTKYMCVAQTDNTHQSITAESTATHVDSTTLHVFEIQYNGTTVYYLIDNVLVGTQTTNLPTVVLAPFVFIDNVGATGAPAFDYAYMLIEGRQ